MRRKMRSFISYVIIMLNFAEAFYKVIMIRDKILHGCNFRNTSETTIGNCLEKCLEDCTCRAFRLRDEDKTCSLCLSSNISLKIEDKPGECGYFVFERNQQHGCKNGAMKGCLKDTNCCLTSQPCLVDGRVCKPSSQNDILHSPRFTCGCPPGYRGNHCEQPIKSCRGYVKGSGHDPPASGNYTILDNENKPFRVFCNFVTSTDHVTVSWTLIQSYRFEYGKPGEKRDKIFQKPFFQDHSKNAENPNWESYRLSLSRMHSIQSDSSQWRMTCRYDVDGLNKTDYMEGLKSQVDILRYNNSECRSVKFINVRGYECTDVTNCQVRLKQSVKLPFHLAFHYQSEKKCSLKPEGNKYCNSKNEHNFGRYKCNNPAHRCSMSDSSTTQTWLGALIEA